MPRSAVEGVFRAGDAKTAASVAAETVLIAEVEQDVAHEREDIGLCHWQQIPCPSWSIHGVDAGVLVAKLGFDPDGAEIITGDRVNVVACLVIDRVYSGS